MKTLNSVCVGLLTLYLVTGCGGGGGARGITGSAGLGTTVTNGVAIDASNAMEVAAAVLYGIKAVIGSSDSATSAPPLVTGVAVNATMGNFSLAGLVLDQLARVSTLQASGTNGIVGAAVSNNVPCAISGVAAVDTSGLANPGELAVNDTLGVSFVMCNEIGILVDGRLTLTVTAIDGSTTSTSTFDGTAPYNITLDVVFTDLRALDGSEYFYANGPMRQVLIDDIPNTNTVKSVISSPFPGDTLDTSYNNQYPLDTAFHDQRLTDYHFEITTDVTSSRITRALEGTVESRDIDGTVLFTNTDQALGGVEFQGDVGIDNPDMGTLVIVSDLPDRTAPTPDGSRMKLVVTDSVDVVLHVDTDNDGDYVTGEPSPIPITWAALSLL